jgi:WD40 repeat protein
LGSAVFNPDGQTLAWCGERETVTISDLGSGQRIATLRCPMEGPIQALAYSPDGQRLAVACDAAELIRVFDTRTGLELPSLAAATEGASTLAYSPDGLRLVSANRDGTVQLWDARTCQELLTIREFANDDWVMSAVFSPDGRRLAANSIDGIIKIWEPMPEK